MAGPFTMTEEEYEEARKKDKHTNPDGTSYPSTDEIREKNPGKVGGGNAAGSTDSGGTHASTTEVSKPESKGWSNKMSKASDVFAKLAQHTPGSVHRGVDYNKNIAIREGASKNELAQSDEIGNYDAWLKRQNKEKKNNSNYA